MFDETAVSSRETTMSDIRLDFQPSGLLGRKQFEVPWQRANEVRSQLRQRGIPATCVWEQGGRKASIEVHADVATETVLAALA